MTDKLDVATVLERAADLISKPGTWTRGAYARDCVGSPVSALSPKASCFCIAGAVINVVGNDLVTGVLKDCDKALGPKIGRWNDDPKRTQDEAVQALRAAAAKVRSSHA